MLMSCRHTKRLLSSYLDGACSPRQRARVEAHTADCAACAALLRELRRTTELLAALPEERTSDGFMAALVPKLRELEQRPEPGALRRALQWVSGSQVRWQAATAGALALVLAVGVFGIVRRGDDATTARDKYLTSVVERHRRLAATTLPFDDRAMIYAGYEGALAA